MCLQMSHVRAVNPTYSEHVAGLLHLVINHGNKSDDLHMHNKSDAPECKHIQDGHAVRILAVFQVF